MKWKIGAVLMAIVFCLAILPPLISGASAGGFPLLGGSSSELVLQEGNDRAMLNGKEVSLGENAAVYRSEAGDAMVPIRGLSDALGMEMEWDNAAQTATLTLDKTAVKIAVDGTEITGGEETVPVSSPAVNTNGTLYVPVKAVSQAFAWGYAEDSTTSSVIVNTKHKEIKDKDAQKLGQKAVETLGVPRATLLANILVFRTDSDYVVKNGENVDLMDGDEVLYTPMIANDKYYLPAKAVACVLDGQAEDLDDGGAKLTIGEKSIELTSDGGAKVDGKDAKGDSKDVLVQDDVLYVSSSLLTSMLEYSEAGEGEVCMIGSQSFANATSQVAYLTSLGEALPEKRPPIPKADAYVALTFDDGPTGGSSGLTARLLNGLQERGAHATFFMCGYRIKDFHTHMDRYLAEGHELGNHTMDHPGLLTKKSYDTIIDQIQSNDELIESYCGEKPTVFRPVGGAVNDDVKNAAKELGLPIINWSVDTEDWKYRNAEHIRSVIVENAKDGDIVLMHDLRDCTLEGALAAIDELSEKGYAFVTVEELARIKGVEMEPGEVYTDFRDSTVEKIKNGTYEARY